MLIAQPPRVVHLQRRMRGVLRELHVIGSLSPSQSGRQVPHFDRPGFLVLMSVSHGTCGGIRRFRQSAAKRQGPQEATSQKDHGRLIVILSPGLLWQILQFGACMHRYIHIEIDIYIYICILCIYTDIPRVQSFCKVPTPVAGLLKLFYTCNRGDHSERMIPENLKQRAPCTNVDPRSAKRNSPYPKMKGMCVCVHV